MVKKSNEVRYKGNLMYFVYKCDRCGMDTLRKTKLFQTNGKILCDECKRLRGKEYREKKRVQQSLIGIRMFIDWLDEKGFTICKNGRPIVSALVFQAFRDGRWKDE